MVKEIFEKVPEECTGEESCKILINSADEIRHALLTEQNTTIDREQEELCVSVYRDFMHTYNKELKYLREVYDDYVKNRTLDGMAECIKWYERAYVPLLVNLQPLLN